MAAALDTPAVSTSHSADLDPDVDRLIEDARSWVRRRLQLRDRLPGIASGGAFLALALTLLLTFPAVRSPGLIAYVVLTGAYALASRVEFEVGPCFALPTQLVFVPMLFVLPLRAIPLCVAAALLAGDVATCRRSCLDRVPLRLANAWHTIGPVLVLGAAGAPEPTLGAAPIIAAAIAAQFAFDFGSTALLEWLRVGVSPRRLVRFAAWAYLVDVALTLPALAIAASTRSHPEAVVLALPLVGLLAFFARERKVRIDHALELSQAYRGTALLLGDVIEADDAYTGSHSRHVVDLVLAVSDRLGLDARQRRNAEFTALLHDVGKVRVPGEIINKPGKLDPAERAVIELHTVYGEEMLERVGGLLGEVGRLVRSCHERWDGGGYPDGLAGDGIPLVARIVCACDAFSAMTTDRPYRRARSEAEALLELHRCSGTHFDPRVVEAIAVVATPSTRAA